MKINSENLICPHKEGNAGSNRTEVELYEESTHVESGGESIFDKTDTSTHRQLLDLLQQVFYSSHVLTAYLNTTFQFLGVNNAYSRAVGHPPHFFIGKKYFELYPDKNTERIFQHVVTKGESYSARGNPLGGLEQLQGIEEWDWTLQPIRGEQNTVAGLCLIITDVTQRVQQLEPERQAANLEDQALLFDLAHDCIFVRNIEGEVLFWNRSAEHTYGWKRQEALGKISYQLLKTRFPEPHMTIMRRLLRDGRWEGRLGHTTKQGSMISVQSRWVVCRTEEGEALAILEIDRDVTKQKRALLKAEQARRYAESIIETVQVALVVLSSDLKVLYANKTFFQTFEVNAGETEGRFIYDLGNGQWDIPRLRELLEDILPSNAQFEGFEVEHDFERIGHRSMLLNARRLQEKEGQTQLILLAIEDKTRLKRQQKEIQAQQQRLALLTEELLMAEERERRRLAVGLHDSIGQILAFSKRELSAIQKTVSTNVSQRIADVKEQLVKAIGHTKDLTFDLSPATLHTFGLEAAVEELLEKFCEEHDLAHHFYADERPKPVSEQVSILLYRAIRELLANVAKHAVAREVKISMTRQNGQIEILVQDDGKGFDPSIIEVAANSRKFGLLSVSQRLRHIGGRLDIRRKECKGMTLKLRAPLELSEGSGTETQQ